MGSSRQRLWILALAIIAVSSVCLGDTKKSKIDIQSMLIESRVTSRFARVFITTEVQNLLNSSQEAIFDIELPKTAFITNFSMTIDNDTTVGIVKEKSEAKKIYHKAISRGHSAGLVQSTGRKLEHFKVSVNVGALAKATFKLTYEELLKRQLGKYELYLRVKPQGLVENFQINVDIIEPQGISFLKADGSFMANELADIVKINRTETKAHIEFKPTMNQQRKCPNCIETLLDGDLKIQYDVKRENLAGKLQVINGYFVHYFAPPSLQRIPKNVVFVIDRSGSMFGKKIKQTHEAFLKILEDVPKDDHFTIITFADDIKLWNHQLVKAVPENIEKAKDFVSQITARGGTDINTALLTAAKMLTNAIFNGMLPEVSASIIIFLSDGEPTSGTTSHEKIIDNVKRFLEGRVSLYCLGFGNDVDYNFLEKLALQNGGLARRIYEDSDSALQLQGFYNEVAFPMLLDVHLQYMDNSVNYLTQNSFKLYYRGSEIIVAGHITNNSLEVLSVVVKAKGVSEPFSVKMEMNINEEEEVEKEQLYIFGDFIERLWAYITIEQLMTEQISLNGKEKKEVMEKALNLSLKYNFVTPLTSLVVTTSEKEEENRKLEAYKPKEYDQDEEIFDPTLYLFNNRVPPSKTSMDSHYYVGYDAEELNYEDTGEEMMVTSPLVRDCKEFHVLLRGFKASNRICFHISQDNNNNTDITLLHDSITGITLSGRLADDRSFRRYDLLNSKLRLRAEIRDDKVVITQGLDVKTYNWNSSFDLDGFLQKDRENIKVIINDGVYCTIFRTAQTFRLSLSVEEQHSPTNHTIGGIIGQLLNNNKTSFYLNNSAGDPILPSQRFNDCDFSPYEAENPGSCLFTSVQEKDLTNATN